jgi:hypothetical protein
MLGHQPAPGIRLALYTGMPGSIFDIPDADRLIACESNLAGPSGRGTELTARNTIPTRIPTAESQALLQRHVHTRW